MVIFSVVFLLLQHTIICRSDVTINNRFQIICYFDRVKLTRGLCVSVQLMIWLEDKSRKKDELFLGENKYIAYVHMEPLCFEKYHGCVCSFLTECPCMCINHIVFLVYSISTEKWHYIIHTFFSQTQPRFFSTTRGRVRIDPQPVVVKIRYLNVWCLGILPH